MLLSASSRTPFGSRRSVRGALLASVSVVTLLMAAPQPSQARQPGVAMGSAAAAAAAASLATAQQAAQIAAQSQRSLTRSVQILQALMAAQTAARSLAQQAPSTFPDGLATGGLVPDNGLAAQGISNPVSTWIGANAPTQTTANGQTTVNIQQLQSSALLNWQTFNVSKNTIVNFDQQGNSSWIALNRIVDPSGQPSQILGQIQAVGQVYLINRNGIIFGGSSQINVGSLLASALPINDALVNAGTLFSNLDSQFTFSSFGQPGGTLGPTAAFAPDAATAATADSKVVVQAGAMISTPLSPTQSGGRVILIGPEVDNQGTISTPDGQTILAAGQQVALLPHVAASSLGFNLLNNGTTNADLRGLDVFVGAVFAPTIGVVDPSASNTTQISSLMTGNATNGGLILAARGDITIAGATVNQLGAALATTSASNNGRIDLLANFNAAAVVDTGAGTSAFNFPTNGTGAVTLGAGSLTQILPEYTSAETALGTTLALPSEINITGGSVYMGVNAEMYAPNAQVQVVTTGNFYADTGAVIDVGGSTNVDAPISENLVAVQLLGAQLADSPLQRDGALRTETIIVDIRESGLNADGSTWIGTPLADASGYANLIQHNVGELTIDGGSIRLQAGNAVVLQQGSLLNVSGGFINFQGGNVATTRLIGADGRIYNVADATPDRVYVAILGGFTVDHSRWNVTETYNAQLLTRGQFEPGYVQGGAGGSILIQAPEAELDGTFLGLTVNGPFQQQVGPTSPVLSVSGADITGALSGTFLAPPSALTVTLTSVFGSADIVLQAGGSDKMAGPPSATIDPAAPVIVPTDTINSGGFGSLTINTVSPNPANGKITGDGNVTVESDISLQPGGTVTINANNIDVEANITAPGGSINLKANVQASFIPNDGVLTLGEGDSLNVDGLTIDKVTTPGSILPSIINAGSVSLSGFSVQLMAGSVVDASGGVLVNSSGKVSGGNGGNISVSSSNSLTPPNNTVPTYGDLVLDGTLSAFGVGASASGGTLSLQAGAIRIGGQPSADATLQLAPDFFDQGGFANFVLTGTGGLTVASGTMLAPVAQSDEVIEAVDGAPPVLVPIVAPITTRDPVTLSLVSGNNLSPGGKTAAGVVIEAGAEILLAPTGRGTGTVKISGLTNPTGTTTAVILGSIIVPGGTISITTTNPNGPISLDLGPGSLLSTAGAFVLTVNSQGRPIGEVLNGGTITLSGNILAEPTAVIDVSGTSGVMNVAGLKGSFIAIPEDSNGGTITFNESGTLFIGATLHGDAGGPDGLGGSLLVNAPLQQDTLSGALQVSQQLPTSVTFKSGVAAIGTSLTAPPNDQSSSAFFAADSFADGHFDRLTLGGPVAFSGPVSITTARSLTIATGGLLIADAAVTLNAPDVALGTPFATLAQQALTQQAGGQTPQNPAPAALPSDLLPTSGSGSLNVTASDLIDVGTVTLFGVGNATLNSTNDIRGDGTLLARGNINLTAGQIYPVTDTAFTIAALDGATPGRINVSFSGVSRELPLSGGGELNLFATTIVQDGVLRAPLGVINIGADASAVAQGYDTSISVTLGSGSVTSVSAVDPITGEALILPFGLAPNDTNWTAPNGLDITTTSAPGKAVNVSGTSVSIDNNAVIDLSGGGDLFASNFVPGEGGNRDVLASANSFAIIPGFQANFAPVTQAVDTSTNTLQSGWTNSALSVGEQITLTRSTNGLPAGTYTLLPARFALLPGAFLITPAKGLGGGLSIAEPDGSSLVSGTLSNALNGGRGVAPLPSVFSVENAAQVNASAEYDGFLSTAFVTNAAQTAGVAIPRLPIDAGVLTLNAISALTIEGAVKMTTPQGGVGGIVAISSTSNIVINDTGTGSTTKTLYLDASGLSNFGADTLIIGGKLAGTGGASTLTATTASIEVDNDTAHPLSGPDVVLISSGNLTLDTGSDVEQAGALLSPAIAFQIGNSSTAGSGNGVALRVSSDPSAQIVRTGVSINGPQSLVVNAGAEIEGVSVILDSTGSTSFDPSARLSAEALTLGSGQISLLLNNPDTLQTAGGLVLPTSVLTGLQSEVQTLSLLSYSTIDIYGTGTIGATDTAGRPTAQSLVLNAGGIRGFNTGDGAVTLNAQSVTIENTQGVAAAAAVPGVDSTLSGTLAFNADTLQIGSNAFNVVGYDNVVFQAPNGTLVEGTGSFGTAGDLTLTTAGITAAAAASQTISAEGALTVNGSHSALTVTGGLGGSLTLIGASVTENGDISLPSGILALHATNGDVTVTGTLEANGTAQVFADEIQYTSGGQITLTSDTGSVILAPGSIVSVAADADAGNAGSLNIQAPTGQFIAEGTLNGQAGSGGASGLFSLDVGSAPTLGALNAVLNAADFDLVRSFRVRNGNVTVDGLAQAGTFVLSADSGSITVTGTVDASGTTGGEIDLYAYNGVTLTSGSLLSVAAAQDDDAGKGGLVDIETGEAKLVNNVLAPGSGWINIETGATIDLAVANGSIGGALHLRAPQINGTNPDGSPILSAVQTSTTAPVNFGNDLAIQPINGTIQTSAGSVIVAEGFQVFDLTSNSGTINAAAESNVATNARNFASITNMASITSRLLANNASLSSMLQIDPGEELTTTSGNLTLPASADWNFFTLRFGPNVNPNLTGSGNPGILTLRAAGNIILLSSITDGFMPTTETPSWDFADSNGNAFDPTTERWNDVLLPQGSLSWSFRLTAGADFTAANFAQVVPGGTGSVELGVTAPASTFQTTTTFDWDTTLLAKYFQVIRTGTGDIDIAAAQDVQLLNPFASIYTAGSQVVPVPDKTLTVGGTVNMAANVPVVFPNEQGSDSITANVAGVPAGTVVGTIAFRPPSIPTEEFGFAYDDLVVSALPAGTVFTLPTGFSGATTAGTVPLIATGSTLVSLFSPGSSIIATGANGSISGVPGGVPITLSGSGVKATSSGVYQPPSGPPVRFNAGDTLPGGSLKVTFDSTTTLTGAVGLTLPAGTYEISTSGTQFTFLSAGTTLTPQSAPGVDSSGGLLMQTSNFNGAAGNTFVPSLSVVADIPLLAGQATKLGAGSDSVTLNPQFANGSITLGSGSSTVYSTPSLARNTTSVSFDTPTTVGDSLLSTIDTSPANLYYPPQFSTGGGNVTINAGRDIIHMLVNGSMVDTTSPDSTSLELPSNWLYRRDDVSDGQFTLGYGGDIQSTAWWIDFSNFTEGVGALGGGNVTLKAGRDIYNVDAVIPTNAWAPSSVTTVDANGVIAVDRNAADHALALTEYGGGDLTIIAGRNISGGVYYVEKGNGTLTAGANITTDAAREPVASLTSTIDDWLPTTLILGQGNFNLNAGGNILLGNVVNAFMLPQGLMNGTNDRTYFSTFAATDTVDVSSLSGSVSLRGSLGTGNGSVAVGETLVSWFAVLGADVANSNGVVGDAKRSWLWLIDQPTTQAEPPTFVTSYAALLGLMPPSLSVTTFSGDINLAGTFTLAPSPTGTLNLAAAGSINGFQLTEASSPQASIFTSAVINISDANPASFPTPAAPMALVYPSLMTITAPVTADQLPNLASFSSLITETGATEGPLATPAAQDELHDSSLLHAKDTNPVRITARSGDITGLQLFSPKMTEVFAGRDILDIALDIQNLNASDTSSVIAGRDIIAYDEDSPAQLAAEQALQAASAKGSVIGFTVAAPNSGDISIGGPGSLLVLAGRDLSLGNAPSPGTDTTLLARDNAAGFGFGLVSIGNERNPFLPSDQGASITAAAGVSGFNGQGNANANGNANFAAFIAAFLDPATAGAEAMRNLPYLATLLKVSDPDSAWAKFEMLSPSQQQALALDIFYMVLRDAGRDHNDPNAVNGTRNYEVGFQAIATLFPDNDYKGNISLAGREIKTSLGGDINLLAPGGQVLVGLNLPGAPPLDEGILTLESGNISIFAKDNVTLGTSRIFTFRGGNEIVWSSTGNIAAGSAAKTLVSAPPSRFQINTQTGASTFDPGGLATGGGIGVLQTIVGAPPGNIDLIAPAGFVDAGDAGIRSSGNLNIAALTVLNAFNIQAQGTVTGIPIVQAPNVSAGLAASNTAGAAAKNAESPSQSANTDRPSIIIVEVLGYGGSSDNSPDDDDQRRRDGRRSSNDQGEPGYNDNSAVQIAGYGPLSEAQTRLLTPEERRKLNQ